MTVLGGFVLLSVIPAIAGSTESKPVMCEGKNYRYLLSAPQKEQGLPALLLLHGAGDAPEPMIEAWQDLAKKENFLLIAAELPLHKDFEPVAPKVFICIVEDAKQFASIDAKHVYIFGNSLGGYLAYDAVAYDSEYFAAVAVHAMGIDPEYDGILDQAKRRMAIAIYMGDKDPLVSLENVRRTRDL